MIAALVLLDPSEALGALLGVSQYPVCSLALVGIFVFPFLLVQASARLVRFPVAPNAEPYSTSALDISVTVLGDANLCAVRRGAPTGQLIQVYE